MPKNKKEEKNPAEMLNDLIKETGTGFLRDLRIFLTMLPLVQKICLRILTGIKKKRINKLGQIIFSNIIAILLMTKLGCDLEHMFKIVC